MHTGLAVNVEVRAPDNVHNLISMMPISSPNPMFDNLFESSLRDNFNKCSNIKLAKKYEF